MKASPEQLQFHQLACQLFLLSSLPTFLITRFIIVAPFGRHVPSSSFFSSNEKKLNKNNQTINSNRYRWWYGPKFNARLSWFLFECPNLIWSCYCYYWYGLDGSSLFFLNPTPMSLAQGSGQMQVAEKTRAITVFQNNQLIVSANLLLLLLFTLHYINRAIIYPLRMNSNSQDVPLIVTLSAMMVTIVNGYLQCFYLCQIRPFQPLVLLDWNNTIVDENEAPIANCDENSWCWLGVILFVIGAGINFHSDGVLRNLRRYGPSMKPEPSNEKEAKNQSLTSTHQHEQCATGKNHSSTYYIPHSPFFQYISCPNFFGELLEWFGFAMASNFSLPSLAFVIYTASNLIPRGVAHHEWYLRKFEDYPSERKWAVIPFVV